jgi:hypothetical protein
MHPVGALAEMGEPMPRESGDFVEYGVLLLVLER